MVKLDALDIRILETLQANGKLTNVELAKTVGLSQSPCLTRVKVLEDQGLISHYVALLDPEVLGGLMSVFIQVRLERQAIRELGRFEGAMTSFPEVMECYLMTGEADYMLRVIVPRSWRPPGVHRGAVVKNRGRCKHPLQFRSETGEVQNGISAREIATWKTR